MRKTICAECVRELEKDRKVIRQSKNSLWLVCRRCGKLGFCARYEVKHKSRA